jgi:hypothetical protein
MDVLKIILTVGAPFAWVLCAVPAWRMWRALWWRLFGEDVPHPRRELAIHVITGPIALIGNWLAVRMYGKGHRK